MPKYLYRCKTCNEEFSAHHLMSENLEKREGCEKECTLNKVPSFPINLNKKNKEQKVGEFVKQHIKETKEDLKAEKKNLKKQEYVP
tara:strand:+ start:674 stop:931 length:258 start_codon:yes stop_codon:yes gene_type:complete